MLNRHYVISIVSGNGPLGAFVGSSGLVLALFSRFRCAIVFGETTMILYAMFVTARR
jgi:hypothetical protein